MNKQNEYKIDVETRHNADLIF